MQLGEMCEVVHNRKNSYGPTQHPVNEGTSELTTAKSLRALPCFNPVSRIWHDAAAREGDGDERAFAVGAAGQVGGAEVALEAGLW
jgi:hypothetical protein